MKEIWKDIKDYDGKYSISISGKVKNNLTDKLVAINDNGYGYMKVVLRSNNSYKNHYIHRLVAIHFIDNPENKSQVNHIDSDKNNNHVDNLEWTTPSENIKHGVSVGKVNAKKRGKTNKLTHKDIEKAVALKYLGYGIREIGDILGFARTTISSLFNDRSNPLLVYSLTKDYAKLTTTQLEYIANKKLKT